MARQPAAAGSPTRAPCSAPRAREPARVRATQLRALTVARIASVELDSSARRQQDHPGHDEGGDDESDDGEGQLKGGHRVLTAAIQKAPAARIDGTHRPTNRPSSRLPVNHSATESANDAPAATRNNRTPVRYLAAAAASCECDTAMADLLGSRCSHDAYGGRAQGDRCPPGGEHDDPDRCADVGLAKASRWAEPPSLRTAAPPSRGGRATASGRGTSRRRCP